MSDRPTPIVRRANEIEYAAVDAAEGLRRGVLVDDSDGAPNFAIRRFTLDPGASVPKHTNEVEHEQYVLDGSYTVGLGDEEYEVSAGDSLFIPAGVVHWYRNEGDEPGAFLCAVPNGDDAIDLVDPGGSDDSGD
ncbi:cupin domain-containing protein [Halegenticoccus soli]|uniref:cupin domain-containing protein n=1 Tax=Halegenticoccus soli TaxID=1985678 RepID=UPI000C6C98A9|nr:cupin domain-containing protein [Halegenticoccus soli]